MHGTTIRRAERCARDLGCKTAVDLKEIWSDPEIAAVVICSETNRHHDLVLAAVQAKKHLFVEKPLGITTKESFVMADAIEEANLLFTTGYFMRTAREHIFLKDQISNVRPSEAAERVAVVEAAYASARTQSWVKVAHG